MNKEDKKKRSIAPEDRRDTTADKKRIKKILLITACVFLALLLLLGALELASALLEEEVSDISYEDYRFFEADYSKNILEDKLYLAQNRSIYFSRFGNENVINADNAYDIAPSAGMFYDYFNCLIMGDYASYSSFFTQECLDSPSFYLPERFTMQGVYDVHINMYRANVIDGGVGNKTSEIYEVSYRIFENNGTFRTDILPDETRTLVFEVYIVNGVARINAIGHRANG